MSYNIVAFIPARFGSQRVKEKNIRKLGNHPLIAYAIQGALDSKVFDAVYVSSDSIVIGDMAGYYGSKFIHRPHDYSRDDSPDSEWIDHALRTIYGTYCTHYAIVRPTNPFRTGETIKRAWGEWDKKTPMKAIEPIKQHPYKAWLAKKYMMPLYGRQKHLEPTNTFKKMFYQNGCVEFRVNDFMDHWKYQAFYTEGYEGFDINTIEDWVLAIALIEKGYANLPKIERKPYDTV